ncbi:hypothetical protein [Bradyrhizobium sp.]|uniref:hypothetical protein n=1 Tax=Bradyrhizobium sp. TaxID=376 RepID=UPI003C6AFC22
MADKQKPVAWQCVKRDGTFGIITQRIDVKIGWEDAGLRSRPLYADLPVAEDILALKEPS